MRAAAIEPWREARKHLLKKWQAVRVCEEPSPYYMPIPNQFCHLANVIPEEQEEMVYNELKLFLLGNQTENIRIRSLDENQLPTGIEVNISFDPYIRSEVERFNETLIATATIKICCFAITHDMVTYSQISSSVANCIEKKVNSFILNICTKLDGLSDATQQLNNLFREVHAIQESLYFYSDIVKQIYLEQLIGGQVLTLLDSKRRHVYAGNTMQDLEDVFQSGWKVFARYIGRLVCKFEADYLDYEFVIWSTKDMHDTQCRRLLSTSTKKAKSSKFIVVDALCPKFFTKYLDILVRCAEFGDASDTDNNKRKVNKTGEQESVDSVMEDVKNVDWSNLDVATTVRMLVQFSRKESACLLRQITSVTNVEQAIRDIHTLLLHGSCAHEVMIQLIKTDLLQKPIDEIGNNRLKKLTHEVLGAAAEKYHPFWKYFSFKIERQNVFDMLRQRMRHHSVESQNMEVTPTLFESISVSLECPVEIEPIISTSAVYTLIPIFRIWIHLHFASWKIANTRDSLRGMMPSRSGRAFTQKKHLINALDWEIANFKQKWTTYVEVAIATYFERIQKAVSLDEYTECQVVLSTDVTKMMGLTEVAEIENIKDILNIIWTYDNDDIQIGDLISDFEDVQSRVRMGSVAVG